MQNLGTGPVQTLVLTEAQLAKSQRIFLEGVPNHRPQILAAITLAVRSPGLQRPLGE